MNDIEEHESYLLERWMRFYTINKTIDSPLARTNDSFSCCLYIKEVENVPITRLLGSSNNAQIVGFRFFVSFYHKNSQKFYGNTYKSPTIPTEAVNSSILNVPFLSQLFFHTSIVDSSSVAVFEIVAIISTSNTNDPNSLKQIGVGWTTLPISDVFKKKDYSDTNIENTPMSSAILYQGSPRSLFFCDNQTEKLLVPIEGTRMIYTIQKHENLDSAKHLIKENEIVGPEDLIPGLVQTISKNENLTKTVHLDIGVLNQSSSIHFEKPQLEETTNLYVGEFKYPFYESFERRFLESVEKMRITEYQLNPGQGSSSLVDRRLLIGVHNGHNLVTVPLRISFPKDPEENKYFVIKDCVQIENFILHSFCALILQVEYVIKMDVLATNLVEKVIPVGCVIFLPLTDSIELKLGSFSCSMTTPHRSFIGNKLMFKDENAKNWNIQFSIYSPEDFENNENQEIEPVVEKEEIKEEKKEEEKQEKLITKEKKEKKKKKKEKKKEVQIDVEKKIKPLPQTPKKEERLYETSNREELLEISAPRSNYPQVNANQVSNRLVQSTMRRADRTTLFGFKFEEFLDEKGKKPIEVSNLPLNLNSIQLDLEKKDSFQSNDIFLQFLAFTPATLENIPKTHRTLFFTFQFYKFAQITTERLLIENFEENVYLHEQTSDSTLNRKENNIRPQSPTQKKLESSSKIHPLVRLNDQGFPISDTRGLTMRFYGEGSSFVQYLTEKALYINVWDGESFLPIGSFSIPLYCLLRQQREAIQWTDEFEIVSSDYNEYITHAEFIPDISYKSMIQGKILCRFVNIGRKINNNTLSSFNKENKNTSNSQFNLVKEPIGDVFVGDEMFFSKQVVKATPQKMIQAHPELNEMISQRKWDLKNTSTTMKLKTTTDEETDPRKRKIMREIKEKNPDLFSFNNQSLNIENKEIKEQELKAIQLYRERNKRETITNRLKENLQRNISIYPSFGSVCFFECILTNPYDQEHCFSIQMDDDEINLISEVNQVRNLKRKNGIITPTEEGLVQGNKILLKPRESVYVPFKFQSFDCGQILSNFFTTSPTLLNSENSTINHAFEFTNRTAKGYSNEKSIEKRKSLIQFINENNKIISVVQVNIQPQPFVVDKTFRFYNAENDFLKKNIRMKHTNNNPSISLNQQRFIHCSSSQVVTQYLSPQSTVEWPEISLKYRCGPSPSIDRFYLIVYKDSFKFEIEEIWQIFVHSLQKYDIVGTVGQTTKGSLVLKNSPYFSAAGLIQAFCSHTEELKTNPSSPFTFQNNETNEIELLYKPLEASKKQMFVHIVDIEQHTLLYSWLITGTSIKPSVTKAFEIELSVGKQSNKKIAYTNPYNQKKTLLLNTDRHQLLSFKENQFEVNPSETIHISLQFKPFYISSSIQILLFLNDQELDKTEECIAINASYK